MNNAPVTIIGNLTDDPKLEYTANDQARLSFGVAVNHVWYDKNNEKQEKVSYFNVTAWRYLAENSARVLEKGIGVIAYGRLEQRSYEDKEGNKRSIVELVADDIAVLTRSIETLERKVAKQQDGGQSSSSARQAPQGQARRARPATAAVGASRGDASDSSEPF